MTREEATARLMSPFYLNGLLSRNRIVRSATNDYRGNPDGSISDEQLLIYKELAEGGAGLIITGNFYVSEDGRVDETMPGLSDLGSLEDLRRLTEAVHSNGCAIVAQLNHAGLKSKMRPELARLALPSAFLKSELDRISMDFGRAASIARGCGFDGVQLHCAHGYLLSSFLDPSINSRGDEYGASAAGRARFPLEVIKRIKEHCGENYPLFIKVDSAIMYKSGWDAESYSRLFNEYLRLFEKAGVHAVELSGLNLGSFTKEDHNYFERELFLAREASSLPLILTGGIRSMEDAGSAFDAGADLIGFSRPFILDPNFGNRLLQEGNRSGCISCNACYGLKKPGGKRCALR